MKCNDQTEPFDWLLRYVHFQEHKLLKHVPKDAHILMVGCGNAGKQGSVHCCKRLLVS